MGMGIRKDNILSVVLGFLIIISLFLSYTLWTAGRSEGEVENTSTQTTRMNISERDYEPSEVFRPTYVAIHGVDQENHLMMANTFPLRNLLNNSYMTENLDRIIRTEVLTNQEYIESMEAGQWLEFIFIEEQPIGLLEPKFYDLQDDYMDVFYDRMIINLDNRQSVYLYNTKEEMIYSVDALEDSPINVDPFLNTENLRYVAAEVIDLREGFVYLSTETLSIPYRSYVMDRRPYSVYTSNFFPDTSLVDVRSSGSVTRYIDLTKEVSINQRTQVLTYYRQIQDVGELSVPERFIRSFEQMNRFENWIGTFALSHYDSEEKTVTFRREIEGVPVFSSSDNETISEIGLVESGVTHLKLPLRYTNTPITIEDTPLKELIPGVEVLNELSSVLSDVQFRNIENMTIGYKWVESDETSEVVYFHPTWVILFDGDWIDYEELIELHKEVSYGL